MRLAGIADLSADRAIAALRRTGYPPDRFDDTATLSIEEGIKAGKTAITQDSAALIATPGIDVILEVTGSPAAGIRHALLCCEHKKHIVMINVEADVLAGPLLARKAREAGIIYSMAYGDQPALIAELVDWARTAGFDVVCAGKGTKHLPQYHHSTPDTVWDHYGFTKEQLASGDFNPQMFNSFLDGTKSALEMAAVANGCDLTPPDDGLLFPPCGTHDLPHTLRPKADGGLLDKKGTVEVVSCLETDGRAVHNDLRWGVYVIVEAPGEYQRECFKQYGLQTDSTGKVSSINTTRCPLLISFPVCCTIQTIPPDRSRAWHLRGYHHVQSRANRPDKDLGWRRRRYCKAGSQRRREARWRRWIYGLWKIDPCRSLDED